MKYISNIDFNDVRNAVKVWSCGADGCDGALDSIYQQIPWGSEIESVRPWLSIEERFDGVIPACPHFSLKKIVTGDTEEIRKLNILSFEVATKICDTYESIIKELNESNLKSANLKVCTGVDDDARCVYKTILTFKGENWNEVIRKVLDDCLACAVHIDWDNKDLLIDTCFKSIYDNHSVICLGISSTGEPLYLEFNGIKGGKKLNEEEDEVLD